MKKTITLAIICSFILLTVLVSSVSAFDSGWKNLRDNGISVACGGNYPACTNAKVGVDWFKQISNINEKKYGLICGQIPEVGRVDCLLHHNAAVGQIVSVPSYGSYYVLLATWYGYTSADSNEKMKVGVTKDWTDRSSYQNVKDLGSGQERCVLRNPVYIGNAKTKLWIQGTEGSVHPYSYRIASCIPQGVVDNGLVYCDNGAAAVANCPVCTAGTTQTCSTGLLGVCSAGAKTCSSQGQWGSCNQNVQSSLEICDNKDNNCNGLIDENLNRSASQLGRCSNNKQYCSAGNWFNFQNNFIPTTETCNGLDDDCDGDIDENLNCNPECTQNSNCTHLNLNSSNYCYSDDVYKNSTIFSCISYSCQADPFSLIKVQECGTDSHEVSANYCLGNNVTRNVTDIDRGCSSSSCFATGQPVVETVQTCQNGCTNGACNSCVPTAEVCDGVDNDCDGEIDEGGVCNQECTQNSNCTHLNLNSSNYCYSEDVYKNSTIFSCISNSCQANPFQRILIQDCGNDSQEVISENYCGVGSVIRNITYTDRGCNSGSCFSTDQVRFEVVEDCDYGCSNSQCNNQTNSTPVVKITYPANGQVFSVNGTNYALSFNSNSTQEIETWSYTFNGLSNITVVSLNSSNFSRQIVASLGVNNLSVCGTNVNGTSCDSISFSLRNNNTLCVENWRCDSWSDCEDEIQTRDCRDLNSCGTTEDKPDEERDCDNVCSGDCNEENLFHGQTDYGFNLTNYSSIYLGGDISDATVEFNWNWILFIIALIVLFLLIILFVRLVR